VFDQPKLPHTAHVCVFRSLEGRLAYLGPVRSLAQLDPGVLDAPVGYVTVAFMNVVGAQVGGRRAGKACATAVDAAPANQCSMHATWFVVCSALHAAAVLAAPRCLLIVRYFYICMNCVPLHLQTLLSWNADVAQQALKTFHGVVGEELKNRKVGSRVLCMLRFISCRTQRQSCPSSSSTA
jgi:hypothetical protein